MSDRLEAVSFKNKNDQTLMGILQCPENMRRDAAIIFLSPGIKNRVGPHRLYVKMAAAFSGMGFPILRMDPEGLGDSEGEIYEELTENVYGSIEVGRYIDDSITLMDWVEDQFGISQFILTGLCGGAITALLTAENDHRVKAILALGIPCVQVNSNIDPRKYITAKQLDDIRDSYLKKIFDPKAWFRFLSFKSDYKLLLQALMLPFTKRNPKKGPVDHGESKDKIENSTVKESNLNPHFHRAFKKFTDNNKILMIFSGSDRLFWEFEEKYLSIFGEDIKINSENYQISIVKDANHVFSFYEWQSEMLQISDKWLRNLF